MISSYLVRLNESIIQELEHIIAEPHLNYLVMTCFYAY